ncbi:MAG: hypothetical protein KDA41_07955, partial [Planctomycetales bacterium]|nr:hypothetical protein [Planctomycetales bacterium]
AQRHGEGEDTPLTTNLCSRTRPLATASDDLKALGKSLAVLVPEEDAAPQPTPADPAEKP